MQNLIKIKECEDYVEVEGRVATFNALDSQGEVLVETCTVDIEKNPVMLTLDWDKKPERLLGLAKVEKRSDGIWAKMKIIIPKHDIHRWELVKYLKPCIGGYVVKKEYAEILIRTPHESKLGRITMLTSIKINEITLSRNNVDSAIIPLDEMIKKKP
jgi:hypothetical protein